MGLYRHLKGVETVAGKDNDIPMDSGVVRECTFQTFCFFHQGAEVFMIGFMDGCRALLVNNCYVLMVLYAVC